MQHAHLLFSVAALAAPTTAQSPTPTVSPQAEAASSLPPSALQPPERTAVYYDVREDETWARGKTYKARIASDGFQYIPFLGSDAPEVWPLGLQLAGATLGGQPLALEDSAVVTREGDRFVLDRGPIDVVYDLSLEGVEQSFVSRCPEPGG